MERAELLLLKMLEQLRRHVPVGELLENLRLLEAEILLHAPTEMPPSQGNFSEIPIPAPPAEPEKEYAVLQINEADVERELEELKEAAERREEMSLRVRPPQQWKEDSEINPVHPVPRPPAEPSRRMLTPPPLDALLHPSYRESDPQEEPAARVIRNTAPMPEEPAKELNDSISRERPELAQRFMETPIRDLKKAIGINDRYRFIHELFEGNESLFEEAVKTINGFSIYQEAEFWIRKELKTTHNWKADDPLVLQFDRLVKRRFS